VVLAVHAQFSPWKLLVYRVASPPEGLPTLVRVRARGLLLEQRREREAEDVDRIFRTRTAAWSSGASRKVSELSEIRSVDWRLARAIALVLGTRN
jgi:hypothetical protein